MDESENFKVIAQKIDPGCTLIRTWKLEGGISADITALEVRRPDKATARMVVRLYGAADLASDPKAAQHEFQLLKTLHTAGVPVPQPYFADESGEILPTPFIVIEFVDGVTDLNPNYMNVQITELARVLSQIHGVNHAEFSFLPEKSARIAYVLNHPPDEFDETMDEKRVREVLASVWPLSSKNKSVILHGDFWPGNVLWRDGQIVAVVDWEDAERGDPLADVANARLEILWALGWDAMHDFAQTYLSRNPIDATHLPYWDLMAALRTASKIQTWGIGAETEARWIERRQKFVQHVLQNLS